jgi:glucosamine--fructose-6-phosphate aminotransferase (isomerizing)
MYLGSDAMALAPFTARSTYLEDGDWAVITPQGVRSATARTPVVQRETLVSQAAA